MSNPYLQRLQALKTERGARDELTKLTTPRTAVVADAPSTEGLRIVSFVSTQSRGFSKSEGNGADQGDLAATAENVARANRQNCQNPPYWRTLTVLEAVCPNLVQVDRWQQAVEDGRAFLETWGKQAESLGWSSRDLFDLHMAPPRPHPSYRRLSRYDETGLIWLLQGRLVVALTDSTAAIENPTGAITVYRKNNKPALGSAGDDVSDIDPGWRQ
jgi:hypothetical protein